MEVHHQKDKVDNGFAGFRQFCEQPVQLVSAFALAKFAFDGDSVDFVGSGLLRFCGKHGGVFRRRQRRAAKSRAGHPNVALFAKLAIVAVSIDFIGMNGFGVKPESAFIVFYLAY